MDLVTFRPVFLVFALLPATLAQVEAPANVTLRCHNLDNVVEWSYNQILPRLRFRVDIKAYQGEKKVLWVDPPALQANLSFLSKPKEAYFLSVTAVLGHNESESAPPDGIVFSYFQDTVIGQKCSLDLPSVNVTALPDNNVLLHFMHPWLLYFPKKTKRSDSQNIKLLPEFTYSIDIVNQKTPPHSGNCVNSVCEEKLPVDAALVKHCLNITGELEKMEVRSTKLYCAMPYEEIPPELNNYIFIVIGLVAACAAAFVLVLLYIQKTRPLTDVPKSILVQKKMQRPTVIVEEQINVVQVEPSSPTPLLTNEVESEFTTADTRPAEPDFRLPIRKLTENEDACEVTQAGEANDEEEGYIGGRLDDDWNGSDATSGYEKRDKVLVDLGEDELAEGYRASGAPSCNLQFSDDTAEEC